MEIINSLFDLFGIVLLEECSTFIDFMNILIKVFCAIFIFAFFIRSICLVCVLPERRKGF